MKSKIFFYLIGLIILFTSCEQFLTEDPKSSITSIYSETPEGVKSAIDGIYSYNRTICTNMLYTGPAGTDIWTMAVNQTTWRNMAWYIDERMKSSSQHNTFWRTLNIAVDRALFALESLEKVDIDQSEKDNLEGEVKALLAFWRFLLVETYGSGAHFAEEATRTVKLNGNQQPVDVFYKDILNNIDFAIDNLPEPGEVLYGKVNVAVAKAMKAKFLLGLAGYDNSVISSARSSLTKEKCIEEAKQLALDVINNYDYNLLEDFASLWDINNEINDEVIWSVQFIKDNYYNGSGNNLHFFWVTEMRIDVATGALNVPNSQQHTLYYGKKQSYVMPTLYYLQSFGKYDKRLYDSFIDTWLRLENDDPMGFPVEPKVSSDTVIHRSLFPISEVEREQFASRGVIANGLNDIYDLETGIPTENGRKGFHTFTKHLDPTREEPAEENGYKDFVFIRLAEMYLIVAECEVRQGNSAGALPYIKEIRKRAIIEGHEDELLSISPGDIDMDFILDEYGRELGGELWRWYLLKRTGTLNDRVKKYNPDLVDYIKPHHVVRPIPQAELDVIGNPDEFVQNPGY